jgi:uncharacterized protein
MIVGIGALLLLAVITLPQLWVRHTISSHGADRPDLPGNGAELARHLLNRFDLPHVTVEDDGQGRSLRP